MCEDKETREFRREMLQLVVFYMETAQALWKKWTLLSWALGTVAVLTFIAGHYSGLYFFYSFALVLVTFDAIRHRNRMFARFLELRQETLDVLKEATEE